MSKIRLHGSSSGYTEIAPVAASGNNTLTLPNDGTIISQDSNGAVGVTSITVGTGVKITSAAVGVTSITVGTGVTIGDGRVTCSTFHGSGANITGISTAATSDFVKLQSADSTTDVSNLTFDSLDVTTYKSFRIIGSVLPTTDDAVIYFRFRASGSDLTSNYNSVIIGVNGASNVFDLAHDESQVLISDNSGNATYEGMRFDITVTPRVSGDASHNNFGFWQTAYYSSSSSYRGASGQLVYKSNDTADGFKLYVNTGNMGEYSYCLYGVKR